VAAQVLGAVVVATLTCAIVAQATQTISTPNAVTFGYALAPGAVVGGFGVPAAVPVLVMCTCNTLNFRGVGQVTMLSIPGAFLEWVGLESHAGSAITQGFSGVLGTHILYCDFAHQVDIEVESASTFRIRNGAAQARGGRVTVIW
jgi:hypothetical protein